jgi:carbonic anhydrase
MLTTLIAASLSTAALAFDYKQNGADWGLITGNELCDNGLEQSPINLKDWTSEESKDLAISLKANTHIDYTAAKIEITKDTVKVTTPNG